jgi:hypothetical protein
LSRIGFVAIPTDTAAIMYPMERDTTLASGGIVIRPGELMLLCPGEQFHARASGASRWGMIRLRAERLIDHGTALTGITFLLSPAVQLRRPSPAAHRHLRSLHAAAVRMAAKSPQALVDAEAAHGLEQQLLHVIVECLSGEAIVSESRADRGNRKIMVRFEQLLRGTEGVRAEMREICSALQVSERRLRHLCAVHLGMSPMAYDRLRRLSSAHHALRLVDPVVGKRIDRGQT